MAPPEPSYCTLSALSTFDAQPQQCNAAPSYITPQPLPAARCTRLSQSFLTLVRLHPLSLHTRNATQSPTAGSVRVCATARSCFLPVSVLTCCRPVPRCSLSAAVSDRVEFAGEEEKILRYWDTISAFQTSLANNANKPPFTFYDGPPFATGLPHYGHILAGTIKDVVTRYASQTGFYVSRRFGWDCQPQAHHCTATACSLPLTVQPSSCSLCVCQATVCQSSTRSTRS